MKKLYAAVLSLFTLVLLSAPAYADAALPPRYTVILSGALKWVIALAVALVIIAVAVIVTVFRHRRK